jgi:radical SAM protein with 4Fe4S-binding SPASM domain
MIAEPIFDKLDRVAREAYPYMASVEVTAHCNARCEYCFIKNRSFNELSSAQLCSALEKLSKNGIIHVHITGGEPFLRPDILDVLSFAIDNGFFYCTLFSNGTLLSQKHLDFLIRNRDFFTKIQMSVFSHTAATNDAYFGVPGALDTIIKNSLFLKKNGFRVSLAMNVLDFNVREMEETRRFFEDLGLTLRFGYFKTLASPRIENMLSGITTDSFYKQYFLSLRPEALDGLKKQMKQCLEMPPMTDAELCVGRWTSIYMNPQGDLSPCLAFRNMKVGNIFEERSVHDILLSSPDYHTVCACKKADFTQCLSCKFINFCSLCFGEIHTETSSLHAINAQVCNFARALYDLMC